MKTKTASVRLPKEMFEEIDNICDGVGCSRNDWIKDKLREGIREETNENSQEQEENSPGPDDNTTPKEPKEEPKPTLEEIPELKEPKVIIKEVPQDNSNKSSIHMEQTNGKFASYAEFKN